MKSQHHKDRFTFNVSRNGACHRFFPCNYSNWRLKDMPSFLIGREGKWFFTVFLEVQLPLQRWGDGPPKLQASKFSMRRFAVGHDGTKIVMEWDLYPKSPLGFQNWHPPHSDVGKILNMVTIYHGCWGCFEAEQKHTQHNYTILLPHLVPALFWFCAMKLFIRPISGFIVEGAHVWYSGGAGYVRLHPLATSSKH